MQVKGFPWPSKHIYIGNTVAGMLFIFVLVIAFQVPASSMVKSIVQEKELRLREYMRVLGLLRAAYWGSWFVTHLCMLLVTGALCAIVGRCDPLPRGSVTAHTEPLLRVPEGSPLLEQACVKQAPAVYSRRIHREPHVCSVKDCETREHSSLQYRVARRQVGAAAAPQQRLWRRCDLIPRFRRFMLVAGALPPLHRPPGSAARSSASWNCHMYSLSRVHILPQR